MRTPFCSVYGLVGCAGRTALVVRLLFMLNKTALNLSWAGAAMLGQLGHSPSRLWEYLILSSKKSSTPCRNLPNGNQTVARIETGCPTFSCASFSHSWKEIHLKHFLFIFIHAATSMSSLNFAVAIRNSPASRPPTISLRHWWVTFGHVWILEWFLLGGTPRGSKLIRIVMLQPPFPSLYCHHRHHSWPKV